MRTVHPTLRRLAALVALLVAAAPVAAQADASRSPWTLLAELRDAIQKGGPITSRFVQTYVPAGFSDGDEERGQLSMWFPDCLRWSYDPPDTKNFLVCQGDVYAWSEEEPGGRRYQIDPEEEPGLDLLLVPVEVLRERYVASSRAESASQWVIELATPETADGAYTAQIHLDTKTQRVRELRYTDTEGNHTRFTLSDTTPLSHTALFQPPVGVEWTTEP